MNPARLRGAAVAMVLVLGIPAVTLAHGRPVIALATPVVAAGSVITVSGSDVEPGEVFTLTLEGPTGSVPLGQATAVGQGTEGRFTARLTVPESVVPGSYAVRAATKGGEAAMADLTVTAPAAQARSGPAVTRTPTGELHVLDRTKPTGEVIGVIVVALASAGLGAWLVWRRPA